MRKANKFLQQLLNYAELELNQKNEREKLNKHSFFEDLYDWEIKAIHKDCIINDGKLYDENGVLLSKDGGCMNESIPYFVNQSTGYCEDNYYGTMYISIGNCTFVAVSYSC